MQYILRTAKIMAVFFATIPLAGCLQPVDNRNSSLTQGNVQMRIIPGITTKAEILEVFGAPNVTTRDGTRKETWSYQRAATAVQSSSANVNAQGITRVFHTVNIGARASGLSQTSRMITLIIKFDEKDIVSDFKSRESNF